MKSAGVHQRKGFFFIRAGAETEHGLGIDYGPCAKLPIDITSTQLGEAVFEALRRSGVIIPHPKTWGKDHSKNETLQAAGVKSWSTFAKGAKSLDIVILDDELLLTPTLNYGRGRFEHLPDEALHLRVTVTPKQLGQAVRQALALCR